MKTEFRRAVVVMTVGLAISGQAAAEDLTGRLGVTGIFLAAAPLGQTIVRDQGSLGPELGGMLRYGVSKNLSLGVAYENIHLNHGYRVEPMTFNLLFHPMPESAWSPVIQLGGGASSNYPDKRNFLAPVAKGAIGLEYFPCHMWAIGPQLSYTYVGREGAARANVHSLGLGLTTSIFFGGKKATQEAAAPIAAAAPVVAAITPSEATLGPGESLQFNTPIAGASDGGVRWRISPALGSISASGLYMAPATIELAEVVTLTAASAADPAQSASVRINLVPPANAPQAVSMRMDVLFETGKDTIPAKYRSEIEKVAQFMQLYTSAQAVIEGHTDNTGSDAVNQSLSQNRADSIKRELVQSFNIAQDRLTATGYGSSRPIADNKTASGRAQNRRVVATLTAKTRQ